MGHQDQKRLTPIEPDALDHSLAALVSAGCICAYLIVQSTHLHWFLLPLLGCGTLIGADAWCWARGKCATFDPLGMVGLFGFHFFFIAPLLHSAWDFWMARVSPPTDWENWLGVMATLNAFGLVLYRVFRKSLTIGLARPKALPRRARRNIRPILLGAMLVAIVLQSYAYAKLGGISGYISAYEDRSTDFEGMGWIFAISERLPILALLYYALHSPRRHSTTQALFLLTLLFGLALVFGGLRGSRSNTLWTLYWCAGIIHFYIQPISRKLIGALIVTTIGFMYAYSFYKAGGSESALLATRSETSLRDLEAETGRSLQGVILNDLGRADVQAFIAHQHWHDKYTLALGRTYAAAATIIIPKSLWSSRPVGKIKEGTEAQWGPHSFRLVRGGYSTRVYGLAGEAMLNFGFVGALVSFAVLGLLTGGVRAFMASLQQTDPRWLLAPFFINLTFLVLAMDADNTIFFVFKNGAVPIALVWIGTKRHRSRFAGERPR